MLHLHSVTIRSWHQPTAACLYPDVPAQYSNFWFIICSEINLSVLCLLQFQVMI
jgi:hypothetical protein